MSLLNDGQPVRLREIPRGAYVQVTETKWRRLEGWTVLDQDPRRPEAPRFQVRWLGAEEYPSTYCKEPSWLVWMGDAPPSTAGPTS